MNHSEANVLIHNGEIYYSPNCSRHVQVPPKHHGQPPNPFITGKDLNFPRWWSPTFEWMSFIPCNPSYRGFPFGRLAWIPQPEYFQGEGYGLPQQIVDRWARLDDALYHATAVLSKEYKIPAVRPFAPWALYYHSKFKTPGQTAKQASQSRDCFTVWMGLMSYFVAQGVSLVNRKEGVPHWFEILANAGFDQSWLSGVQSSTVCSFGPETRRAGIFVDPFDSQQTSIKWLRSFYVPVWYRWGVEEAARADLDPNFAEIAPPSALLQTSTTTIARVPITIREFIPPPADTSILVDHSPTWQHFFDQRDKRNKRRLEQETPQERERRQNRMKNPSVRKAKVFEWVPSLDDPQKLVREAVNASNKADVLSMYPAEQKRYDPWVNEWDCCEEFAPAARLDEDMDDVILYNTTDGQCDTILEPPIVQSPYRAEGVGLTTVSELQPEPRATPIQPVPPPALPLPVVDKPEIFDLAHLYNYEPVEILTQHYGFLPPLHLNPTHLPQFVGDKAAQKIFLRLLGLSVTHDKIFSTALAGLAQRFVKKLIAQTPTADESDLNNDARAPLTGSRRLKYVSCVNQGLFLFDFGQHTTLQWKLAVTSPSDVLFVCRLNMNFNEYDLARCLIQQGIPFRTLMPLSVVPRPLGPPSLMLPIRLSGYKFTPKDYEAYQEQCAVIFSQPRARAALLRGGIIWRLAVETLSIDDALIGPSTGATIHGRAFTIPNPFSDGIFGDDDLTQVELDLLCGANVCYTGKQMSHYIYYAI
jgi:hypothetical protein